MFLVEEKKERNLEPVDEAPGFGWYMFTGIGMKNMRQLRSHDICACLFFPSPCDTGSGNQIMW
jgi:hypothetical protein